MSLVLHRDNDSLCQTFLLPQERLEAERKEKKKQKDKERKERLKKEGKLLTKSQKEARARAEATLRALQAQGERERHRNSEWASVGVHFAKRRTDFLPVGVSLMRLFLRIQFSRLGSGCLLRTFSET